MVPFTNIGLHFMLGGQRACTDPGPTLPTCSPDKTQAQMIAFAENGNLVCDLQVNGFAEATNLKNVGKMQKYDFVGVCGAGPPG